MLRTVFWRRYFSAKLVIAFIVLITMPIVIISSLFYQSASDVIAVNVRKSAKQTARQAAETLDTIMTIGTDVAQQIQSDRKIQEAISHDMSGKLPTDERIAVNELVQNSLDNLMFHSSFIRSIYIIKDNDSQWGSGLFSPNKVFRHNARGQDWYKAAKENGTVWLPIGYDIYSVVNERTVLQMSLVKGLKDLGSLQKNGVLMVNLDGKLIMDKISKLSLGKTGYFFVVGEQGRIMIDPKLDRIGESVLEQPWGREIVDQIGSEREFEWEIGNRRYYFTTHKIENGWTVAGMVPTDEIIGDIDTIRSQTFLYGLLFSLVAIATAFYISNRTTRPLKRLMKQMKRVGQGDLDAWVEVESGDEIGQLSRRFNEMIGQTRDLMRRVGEEEAQKKDAEIRALRYQINPHFLYNTMSSIRWLVKYNRNDEAYRAMGILARLLESVMGKKGPFSPLRDEIEILSKHMEIHRFRYDKPIHFYAECPDDLLDFQVPNMLLQPIIENAVFHGIAPLERDGEIRLTAERQDQMVVIRIRDNGVGMTPEQAEGLLRSERKNSGMFGIGLRNIHDQLLLYYGSRSDLKVESVLGQGTVVMLMIALK